MFLNNRRILPLQPLNFDMIPSNYENNFTFLENLECIYKKVEEIILFLEDFNMKTIQAKIDEAIEELRIYTDNKNDELDVTLRNYIDGQINTLINTLEQLQTNLQNYTDVKVQGVLDIILSIKNELEEEIEQIVVGNITVRNPTTGTIDPLEKVLNDIYDTFRTEAITVNEFDNLELTATDFDSRQITANAFDLYGKEILIP